VKYRWGFHRRLPVDIFPVARAWYSCCSPLVKKIKKIQRSSQLGRTLMRPWCHPT
jgi:hypothetical protein